MRDLSKNGPRYRMGSYSYNGSMHFGNFTSTVEGLYFQIKVLLSIITLLYCVIQLRHFHLRILKTN